MFEGILDNELQELFKEKYEKGEILLNLGDITKLDVTAIVNAANETLLGGGGVDGAIHRAAGPKLLEECKKLNGCKTGEAKITKGYNLPAKYVIHTVGPIYDEDKNPELMLSNCYKNSLDLAVENNIDSIAFPNISTGVYGYPKEEACKVAIHSVVEWFRENLSDIKVIFVSFDENSLDIYKEAFKSLGV
ncbi:O-acetyl-ADP-ribose deacetylase [Lagierella sp.]|uniref:O-acetyl-ADP-ribose deacetylase n=1 Tax=Lagierella sp. TaxID=2849657 RepID=UPI002631A1C6|nr:O-acetyl-ADP-ribose deacetylase [Lagierella sp.]